jgi:hypothetical protein
MKTLVLVIVGLLAVVSNNKGGRMSMTCLEQDQQYTLLENLHAMQSRELTHCKEMGALEV